MASFTPFGMFVILFEEESGNFQSKVYDMSLHNIIQSCGLVSLTMEYVKFRLRVVSKQSNISRLLFKHSGWHLEIWVGYTPNLLVEIVFIPNAICREYCLSGHYSLKISFITTPFIDNSDILHNIHI